MRIFRCCYAILRYQYLFTIPTLWASKVSKGCKIITTYNFHSQAIFYLLEHHRMVKVLHFAPVFCPEQFHSSRQRQSWQDAELPLNSIPTSGNGGELPWQQLSLQRENLKSRTDQLIVRWIWTKRMFSKTRESVYYIDLNLILVQTFDSFPLT